MDDRLPDLSTERQRSFLEEEEAVARQLLPGQLLRWGLAFVLLFAGVFFSFWWSGEAIRFGAARVAERPQATWRVLGTVRNAVTGEPVRWAAVRDDPAGRPPHFRTDSDQSGRFELLTLAESHRLLIEAQGYHPARVQIGRQWFLWWPHGEEKVVVSLQPE